MKKAAIIFTILLVLGIIITYQLRDKKEKAPEIVYVPYTVTTADVKEVIDTTGEVSALNRVEIKPSVSGRVDRLLVNEGDTVRKGQVLAYLSSSDRVAILDAVRANPNENIKDWENMNGFIYNYRPKKFICQQKYRLLLIKLIKKMLVLKKLLMKFMSYS